MLDKIANILVIVLCNIIVFALGWFIVTDYIELHNRVDNIEKALEEPVEIIIPIPDFNTMRPTPAIPLDRGRHV